MIKLTILLIAGTAWAQGQGSLSVSIAPLKPQSINVSAEGTQDWVHWGHVHGTQMQNRKSGANLIGDLQKIGEREIHTYENNPTAYSWSNGSPKATVAATKSGIFIYGTNNGFEFTLPADSSARRARIYLGVWRATGTLKLELSDGSAPAVTKLVEPDPSVDITNATATIDFKAAKPGQKLTVRFTNNKGGGNMELQAVTLATAN